MKISSEKFISNIALNRTIIVNLSLKATFWNQKVGIELLRRIIYIDGLRIIKIRIAQLIIVLVQVLKNRTDLRVVHTWETSFHTACLLQIMIIVDYSMILFSLKWSGRRFKQVIFDSLLPWNLIE